MQIIVETRGSLSNAVKDTIMCNPSLHLFRQRVTPLSLMGCSSDVVVYVHCTPETQQAASWQESKCFERLETDYMIGGIRAIPTYRVYLLSMLHIDVWTFLYTRAEQQANEILYMYMYM